jgi:hypothetical protein
MAKVELMVSIEKKIAKVNSKERKLMTMASTRREDDFGSILKIESGKVIGLGDVELLSYCDLTSQSVSTEPLISMAISSDENLNKALSSRTHLIGPMLSFQGGTDPTSYAMSFSYSIWRENRKMKMNSRLVVCQPSIVG